MDSGTLRLVVISVDPNAKRMSFSLKQAGPDPWKSAAERYATDMVVPGTVTRIVDFGAFVELEPGLEGLVHVSEKGSKDCCPSVKSVGSASRARRTCSRTATRSGSS